MGQWSVSTKFYVYEQLILSSWSSPLAVKPLNWCHRYDVCGCRWCQKVLKWNGQIRIMVLVSTERGEALHVALCHWCCRCHSFITPHWPRIFQNHSTCMMSSAVLSQIYEIFRISLWCQCPAVSATAVVIQKSCHCTDVNTFELFDVTKVCFQCESSWSTVTRESGGLGSWLGIGGRQEDQEGRIAQ